MVGLWWIWADLLPAGGGDVPRELPRRRPCRGWGGAGGILLYRPRKVALGEPCGVEFRFSTGPVAVGAPGPLR